MLLLTAADRENVIKSKTCIILPKMKHRIEIVCAKGPMSTLVSPIPRLPSPKFESSRLAVHPQMHSARHLGHLHNQRLSQLDELCRVFPFPHPRRSITPATSRSASRGKPTIRRWIPKGWRSFHSDCRTRARSFTALSARCIGSRLRYVRASSNAPSSWLRTVVATRSASSVFIPKRSKSTFDFVLPHLECVAGRSAEDVGLSAVSSAVVAIGQPSL